MDVEVNLRASDLIVDGTRIRIATGGDGPPLVLVHGLGGPLMWQRLTPILAERFSIIEAALPGYGESDACAEPLSTDGLATHLARLLEALGIERCAMAGISYGGQVALSFAHRFPRRLTSLVLIASTGLYVPAFFGPGLPVRALWRATARMVLASETLSCRAGANSFYDVSRRPPELCREFFRQLSRAGHREAWIAGMESAFGERERVREWIRGIECRTLIVWGEHDGTVPVESGKLMSSLLRGSEFLIYPRCAHSVPLEEPERLGEDIVRFIGREEKR